MPSGRAVSNKAPVLLNWSGCEREASTESCISKEPSGRIREPEATRVDGS